MMEKLIMVGHYLKTKYRMQRRGGALAEQWQEKRIRRHIRFVRKKSPYYRKLWANLPDSNWRQFPIIEKSDMMTHFNQLNTVGIEKEQAFELALHAEQTRDFTPMLGSVTIGMSSGTSGNRGLFLVSRNERLAWAGTILAKVLPHSLLHPERIAFFLRADSNLYGSVGSRRLQFQFYDLLNPLQAHIDQLNKQQPSLIAAPPSLLRLLATASQEGILHIRPGKLIAVAEVLDPLDGKHIEAAFCLPIHQIYQCTEGFLASSCVHGTLHINEDIVAVQKEYLDADSGRFVPIITDFSRTTQPIIRYRLHDILTERTEPCPCGSPHMALARIEGRCDDLFYFPAKQGEALVVVYPDFISRCIISAAEEVLEYLAVQHTADTVQISFRLQPADEHLRDNVSKRITASIQRLCDQMACAAPRLQFTRLEYEPGLRKLRRVERRFQLSDTVKAP
ncbi:F390 synthetase-related protein [Paenibacillus sp. HWE-109]|uniref:F390 synthetase-related protein n=1 Tax=Paenibacillus sp. HWE-109 TaxID=1306526 RepID=UPI00307FFFF8